MISVKSASGCIFAAFICLVSQFSSAQSPVQTEFSKLLASDGLATDAFGHAIDVDGDTAVIGAPENDDHGFDSGAVYIFVRDAAGVWTEQAKLFGSDTSRGNRFGEAVGVDGDTIVVGARMKLTVLGRSGSAYVFTRDELGTWSESAQLLPGDGMTGDQFGSSVAIDGDTVIVGSRYDTERPGVYPPGSGSAYVFIRDQAGAWTEQAKIRASDTTEEWLFEFGDAVDVDGDTAVVGADGFDSQAGAAYIFTRDTMGNWTEQAKLLDSEGEPDALFGHSVKVDGDTILVGAPSKGERSGAVYAFSRGDTGVWNEQAKLLPSDGDANDLFGWSVALVGNTAAVGAFGHQANGDRAGAVYVFRRNGETWLETAKLLASDGDTRDYLGSSVGMSEGTVVAGAPGDEIQGLWSGSAYVFDVIANIDIDIRPFSRRNIVVPWSRGLIPVAIVGSADFDAVQVDLASVEFGPEGATPFRRLIWFRDVNRDGFNDLVVMFRVRETGIACGDTEASLTGRTYSAQLFQGTDSLRTTFCK